MGGCLWVAGAGGPPSTETVPATSDPIAREQAIYDMTEMEISLIDPREPTWARTLAAGGVSIDPHPSGYGWFTFPVDGMGVESCNMINEDSMPAQLPRKLSHQRASTTVPNQVDGHGSKGGLHTGERRLDEIGGNFVCYLRGGRPDHLVPIQGVQ